MSRFEVRGEWTFTKHAVERCHEMGVTTADVRRTLDAPEGSHPGSPSSQGKPTTVVVGGDLSIVVEPVGRMILTVLWRKPFER